VAALGLLAGAYAYGHSAGWAKGDAGRLKLQVQIDSAAIEHASRLRAAAAAREKTDEKSTQAVRAARAAADGEYQRLRDALAQDRADGVPDTAPPACGPDAAACNEELLAVLRAAEADRLTLEALQQWIRETTK